jgi:hypothetical protein
VKLKCDPSSTAETLRNSLRRAPFTAVTHPLSDLNAPLAYTGHRTHNKVAVREQANVAACLDQGGQERLGGGRTVGL